MRKWRDWKSNQRKSGKKNFKKGNRENQPTKLTHKAKSVNRTQATLVEGGLALYANKIRFQKQILITSKEAPPASLFV